MKHSLWCVQLLPGTGNKLEEDRNYCLENNVLGLGWAIPQAQTVDDYFDLFSELSGPDWNLSSVRSLQRMKRGDLCWAQVQGGFWLGEINDDEVSLNNTPDWPSRGLFRLCNWKNFQTEAVPVPVFECLVNGRTIQKITDTFCCEYSEFLYHRNRSFLIKKFLRSIFGKETKNPL